MSKYFKIGVIFKDKELTLPLLLFSEWSLVSSLLCCSQNVQSCSLRRLATFSEQDSNFIFIETHHFCSLKQKSL